MVTKDPDTEGKRFYLLFDTKPVYVKPTFWNRYGPGALVNMVLGVPRPGDPGTYPEGFEVKNIGPSTFVGKGQKEMEAMKEKLKTERTAACPFAVR